MKRRMNVSQGIKVRGRVKITVHDHSTGLDTVVYNGPNLIVNNGLTVFGQLLAQVAVIPTNNKITSIKFGTDSTAAAAAQTNIIGSLIIQKNISTYTEDVGGTPGVVAFELTLDTTEGNGSTINEIGLFTANSTMVARRVTPAIPKTNLISVSVEWRLTFTTS